VGRGGVLLDARVHRHHHALDRAARRGLVIVPSKPERRFVGAEGLSQRRKLDVVGRSQEAQGEVVHADA
jgi:hypothetical protein